MGPPANNPYHDRDQLAPYAKTRTALLYLRTGPEQYAVESWGFTATRQYLDICSCSKEKDVLQDFFARCNVNRRDSDAADDEDEEGGVAFDVVARAQEDTDGFTHVEARSHEDYVYLERFKLLLEPTAASSLPVLPAGLTVQRVVADYLRCMHSLFMERLRMKYGSTIAAENVGWYLTVPAMWSEAAKQTMRRAAVDAGLVTQADSIERLSLVLEPEAASLYACTTSAEFQLKDGDHYMIIDAGGGTVDIVCHQIVKSNNGAESLREVMFGSGDSCGSTFVDEEFLRFLASKIGQETIDDARNQEPESFMQLMRGWEEMKRSFQGRSSFPVSRPYKSFVLPHLLYTLMSEKRISELEEMQSGFGEAVFITFPDMKTIFDPVVERTIALIEEQLGRCTEHGLSVEKFFVVGGFSESPYLFRRIQSTFTGRVKDIYRPTNPGSAVVQGAAYSGLNPR